MVKEHRHKFTTVVLQSIHSFKVTALSFTILSYFYLHLCLCSDVWPLSSSCRYSRAGCRQLLHFRMCDDIVQFAVLAADLVRIWKTLMGPCCFSGLNLICILCLAQCQKDLKDYTTDQWVMCEQWYCFKHHVRCLMVVQQDLIQALTSCRHNSQTFNKQAQTKPCHVNRV